MAVGVKRGDPSNGKVFEVKRGEKGDLEGEFKTLSGKEQKEPYWEWEIQINSS